MRVDGLCSLSPHPWKRGSVRQKEICYFFKVSEMKSASKERPARTLLIYGTRKRQRNISIETPRQPHWLFLTSRVGGRQIHLARKTPEQNRRQTKRSGLGIREGETMSKRRCQRPLPGGEGRPLGKAPGSRTPGRERPLTYLVQVRSIFQALSLLSERCSPRSGSSLGK